MGGKQSILPPELLDDYEQLTYLTKHEIQNIFKGFYKLGEEELTADLHHRFHVAIIMEEYPQIKYNPFRERIFRVFSSLQDEHFSFEDFLDFCSVMSENCPLRVKADWVFKIFDINEDGEITKEDLLQILALLTKTKKLDEEELEYISDVIFNGMDIQNVGGLSPLEFNHALSKMPELAAVFSIRF